MRTSPPPGAGHAVITRLLAAEFAVNGLHLWARCCLMPESVVALVAEACIRNGFTA